MPYLVCLTLVLSPLSISASPCAISEQTHALVPFAEASLWALSLRRVRLVAEWSGLTRLPWSPVTPIGGEINLDDWGTDDFIMFEPILYALRNARRAIDTCNSTFGSGVDVDGQQEVCVTARKLRESVVTLERIVVHTHHIESQYVKIESQHIQRHACRKKRPW